MLRSWVSMLLLSCFLPVNSVFVSTWLSRFVLSCVMIFRRSDRSDPIRFLARHDRLTRKSVSPALTQTSRFISTVTLLSFSLFHAAARLPQLCRGPRRYLPTYFNRLPFGPHIVRCKPTSASSQLDLIAAVHAPEAVLFSLAVPVISGLDCSGSVRSEALIIGARPARRAPTCQQQGRAYTQRRLTLAHRPPSLPQCFPRPRPPCLQPLVSTPVSLFIFFFAFALPSSMQAVQDCDRHPSSSLSTWLTPCCRRRQVLSPRTSCS
ncbi:hypothetical protein BC826DRAFT_743216 [Russula brevipes]|nr:hypothetical protein BC826DRAFT_743216 [Russula brevipes]